jgi:hypothetical protein
MDLKRSDKGLTEVSVRLVNTQHRWGNAVRHAAVTSFHDDNNWYVKAKSKAIP